MFLRLIKRRNGKTHVYWNIVENKRLDDGRVVQRQVLYLGEINSPQIDAWRAQPSPHFFEGKMQLEVGILMRREFGSRNRRERGRATTNAGP